MSNLGFYSNILTVEICKWETFKPVVRFAILGKEKTGNYELFALVILLSFFCENFISFFFLQLPMGTAAEVTVPAIAEAIQDRTPSIYDPLELKFLVRFARFFSNVLIFLEIELSLCS